MRIRYMNGGIFKQRPFLSAAVLLVALVAILAASGRSGVAAQDDRPGEEETPLTRSMAALVRDRQPPMDLEALSAVPCVDGFADIYPCLNVDLLAYMPLSAIGGGGNAADIWGWTDPVTNVEYAIVTRSNGTAFVNISDPENPVYIGNLPTHSGNSLWRDVDVYADHAFIGADALATHGMQVFDLNELRDVTVPPVTFSETAHYDDFGNSHTIVINPDSGFAYAVGTNTCSGGLHMVNIQNPANPTFAGCFSADGYTHESQCVNYVGPDPDYQGQEICFAYNEDTVTIVNVTNKSAPTLISSTGYAGSGYTHQGWLTPDHEYMVLDDELDELNLGHNTLTRVWDVRDLDDPVIIGQFTGRTPAIDHNQYIHNGNVYQSNYRAGLAILDAADIVNGNLSEIAYFDIYPTSDSASFNANWGNYPFFESGVVILSGIEQGLFIVQPNLQPDFSLDAQDTALAVCNTGSDSTTFELLAQNGYAGTVTLSTAGLPAGSTGSFSPNPVNPPASSDLTVTVTSTSAGTYPFTAVGTDGALTHEVDMTLNVVAAAPGSTTLIAPADGATNVEVAPYFEWNAAATATSYTLEVATDEAFANVVYSASVAGTSHQATAALEPETTYYWHVQPENICGAGAFSATFSFTTRAVPPILLVDDDDNSPDVQLYYGDALAALVGPAGFEIWDTANSDNEPTAGDLDAYDIVIWFTGDEFGGFAGPGSAGETALATWLDAGGCFLISGQDYHYDRGLTPFMADYLGTANVLDDTGDYSSVTGQGSVFGGLGPYTLAYPFTDYSDQITPTASGELAFQGNNGFGAAVNKETAAYKTTFWTFPWEAIGTADQRSAALLTFLDWCTSVTTGTLVGTVTDAGTGDPISGATVTADDGVNQLTTSTDANGDYDLPLPAGTYTVSADADGYAPDEATGVVIEVGVTTTQDFALTPEAGILTIDPLAIELTVPPGAMAMRSLTLTNNGIVAFDFDVTSSVAWATVDPTSGSLAPGESTTLQVHFDAGVAGGVGTYLGELTFSGTFANPAGPVSLTLHVVEGAGAQLYLPLVIAATGDGQNR